MSNGDSTKNFFTKNGVTLAMNALTIIVLAITFGITWGNQQNAVANNAAAIADNKQSIATGFAAVRDEVQELTQQGRLNAVQFAEIQKDLTQIRTDLVSQTSIMLDIRDRIYQE